MRLRRRLVGAYYAAVLVVVGPLLLAGIAHQASGPLPKPGSKLPKSPEEPVLEAVLPLPASAPAPLAATPRGASITPGARTISPMPAPRTPVSPPPPPGGGTATLATHYQRWSPRTCWDGGVRHDLKELTLYFTAIRGVPCGTVVVVTGAAGSVRVVVWDHGPNCTCPERGLDLSFAAFVEAVGPLSKGIGPATWAPG